MKLELKNSSAVWLTEASRLMGAAPVLVLMCAAVMLILAVTSVNKLLQLSDVEKKRMELPEFSLKKQPVGKVIYEDYARTLGRLSPDVRVTAEKDSIRIDIADPGKYAEFMYVLNSVQGVSKDVVWRAEEICLAGCEGASSRAVIKGITEKIEIKLRGSKND